MSRKINLEHEQAQKLSSRASLLLQRSKRAEARRLFARAARLEKQALVKIPADKVRTRGILSVSFAALLIKAEDYREARKELPRLLEDASLPPSSRRQIENLLEEARQKDQDSSPVDNHHLLRAQPENEVLRQLTAEKAPGVPTPE